MGTSDSTPPTYVNAISRGFEAEVFTGQMPFLSPNQSTKGKTS